MPRDTDLYVGDILEACRRVGGCVAGLDYTGFVDDTRTADAVLRNLEILGEAVKKLPPEMLADAPEIPWRDVAGLRDILAHAYFSVDLSLIWDIVQNELPALEAAIRRLGGAGDGA
jgi:uncharacterized protein with HEPN domain